MPSNSLLAATTATVAIISVSVALILSPWNTASLETTEDIDAEASIVREKCLDFSLQAQWTNKFSANILVQNISTTSNLPTRIRVQDGRKLHVGNVLQIDHFFGQGRTTVQENSARTFALRGTKLGTTAAHAWDFVPVQDGAATRLVHRETWTGGLSFLFMRFGPVRGLLEEMFARFNAELKESAESGGV